MHEGFESEYFDKIVLDPPCSGFGLRPHFADLSITANDLHQHAEYQKKCLLL
jgi:16S rRNA C967 or C1407 C5-methylase (RsmB/RsmF family)